MRGIKLQKQTTE